jgi:hypothetical protein
MTLPVRIDVGRAPLGGRVVGGFAAGRLADI